MGELTRDTANEKRVIEAMVTAILAKDPRAQALVADGLSGSEEAYVRAAASIIAGLFVAIGAQARVEPSKAWAMHMGGTTRSRGDRG